MNRGLVKNKSPEPIIDLIMQYFYDGGKPVTTQDLFNVLSVGRDWLTLVNVRCSVNDIMKRSPDTLNRARLSEHGRIYMYEYSGIPYNPKAKPKLVSIEAREAIRKAERPMRDNLISGKW